MIDEKEIRIRASDPSNLLFGAGMIKILLAEIDRLRAELTTSNNTARQIATDLGRTMAVLSKIRGDK